MSRTLWLVSLILLCLSPAVAQPGRGAKEESSSGRSVAVTVDDLPINQAEGDLQVIQSVNQRLLATLNAHDVPAVGFVNEIRLHVDGEIAARIDILRAWLDAGMTLGNHTYSHRRFHDTPLWQFQDDVIRGEVITRRLLEQRGLQLRYFRHPYTSTGATKQIKVDFEAFLKVRGYTVAPFTVENFDYAFNQVYVRAIRNQDLQLARRVGDAYLEHSRRMFAYNERLSQELLDYEIPQTFVLHVNEINAEFLDEILQMLKDRGYRFITFDEAMAHKAYRMKDGYVGPLGISWLHRWAMGLGQPNKYTEEPDPPRFILDLYRRK